MFIYLCLLQNLSRVCCAAPRPPTMPGSGQAIIIIRPPDTPWPPPQLFPTWTRTPGPWTGSWGSRGTGAGWASAGARTAVTASVSTCGTTWCTCNKRDCVTRDRCDVTRTSARGKCQTQSHSLCVQLFSHRSVIVTLGPALTSSANHSRASELWTNESEACGQLCDTVTKWGELRSSHSQHPLSLRGCHLWWIMPQKCAGSHSCARPRLNCEWVFLSVRGIICCQFDIWLDHCDSYWSWLTLIEANNQTRARLSGAGNSKRAGGIHWKDGAVALFSLVIPEALKPVISHYSHFHFMSVPQWKSIWVGLQVNGE